MTRAPRRPPISSGPWTQPCDSMLAPMVRTVSNLSHADAAHEVHASPDHRHSESGTPLQALSQGVNNWLVQQPPRIASLTPRSLRSQRHSRVLWRRPENTSRQPRSLLPPRMTHLTMPRPCWTRRGARGPTRRRCSGAWACRRCLRRTVLWATPRGRGRSRRGCERQGAFAIVSAYH